MSITPALLALGVILIFGLVLYLMISTSRKLQAQKHHQLATLGFQVPESEPARLQSRVEDLYQTRRKRDLALQAVYHRRELDQELYIFDVISTEGEDSDIGQEVFGVISSQLALPRFSLTTLPDFDRDSLIGGLMDKMLDKIMDLAVMHLGLERVEFPDRPEYEDRFVAFGRDPSAVRDLLGRIQLSALESEDLPVQIAGSGDFLTVDFSISATYGGGDRDLIAQYNRFREICRVFLR